MFASGPKLLERVTREMQSNPGPSGRDFAHSVIKKVVTSIQRDVKVETSV